jgi:hypothetical protein
MIKSYVDLCRRLVSSVGNHANSNRCVIDSELRYCSSVEAEASEVEAFAVSSHHGNAGSEAPAGAFITHSMIGRAISVVVAAIHRAYCRRWSRGSTVVTNDKEDELCIEIAEQVGVLWSDNAYRCAIIWCSAYAQNK